MNLGTFFLSSLIVHDVPRRAADAGVVLSDVESGLDQSLRNFFRERMIRSLKNQAFEVECDPDATSPVPQLVSTLLPDSTVLVAQSQEIARHLWACQTAVNSPGLVVVSVGTVDGVPCVGILKLEREDALRVEQVSTSGGTTFDLRYLQDLMLGKNTRVFKAALFTTVDGGDIGGLVSDDQRGYDSRAEIAHFFLGRFLGCRLATSNDLATKAFFEGSQDWINNQVRDEQRKARYQLALLAHINSPSTTLKVKDFADQHLVVNDRQPYKEFMAGRDVPTGAFTKEPRLIASKVKQLTYATQNGIRITAMPEPMQRYVKVRSGAGDGAKIEIHDELKDVRGGR
jgi:hypothetical protein